MHTNLLVDLNNEVFRNRFAHVKTPKSEQRKERGVTELIFLTTIISIAYTARDLKVDAVVAISDSVKLWRKEIYPEYKKKDSDLDIYYRETIDAANLCREFFEKCSNVSCISVPHCEADDIISCICRNSSEDVNNIIMSSDKDFVQLISPSTRVYYAKERKFRESDDPEFDLFVKAIRGDVNDNLPSAYPRVRITRIQKAYEDSYEMMQLLNTTLPDGRVVGDLVEFNLRMMDLSDLPANIETDIMTELAKARQKNFSEIKMMRFFVDRGMSEKYSNLEYKERVFKGIFRM